MAQFTKPTTPVAAAFKPASAPTPGTTVLVKSERQPVKSNAAVYGVAGLRGSIRFVKTLFAGHAPDRIEINGVTFAEPVPVLTKEERKAARLAMTPQQKIDIERRRVEKATARLRKAEQAARV